MWFGLTSSAAIVWFPVPKLKDRCVDKAPAAAKCIAGGLPSIMKCTWPLVELSWELNTEPSQPAAQLTVNVMVMSLTFPATAAGFKVSDGVEGWAWAGPTPDKASADSIRTVPTNWTLRSNIFLLQNTRKDSELIVRP